MKSRSCAPVGEPSAARSIFLRMLSRFPYLAIFILAIVSVSAQSGDFARWVNPFIGTGGHGHTFPGATMPFGMVQLSPDTRIDNWDGSNGYHYSDNIIYGFSHTHLSGTGIPDYCDILVAPYVASESLFNASPDATKKGYASGFSHQNEKAEPGYYAVRLDDENIYAEMTATPRVGLHRYTFPQATRDARLTFDLHWRDKVTDSELRVTGPNRIEGFRRSRSWAEDQWVYFVAEFSKPFAEINIGVGKTENGNDQVTVLPAGTKTSGSGQKNVRAALRFELGATEKLLVKVAISPVSSEGAAKNLKAELPGWDFDATRAAARAAWNRELSQIEVTGGTDAQRTNFYTALYHTKIQPNVFDDVDGRYRGLDKKIHESVSGGSGGENFTVFSLWDTFRAAHPLYTITDRKRTAAFINTFIRQYKEGGRLPVWELAANETDTMIGYHAVSVIADAMAKGIDGFDYATAYQAARHSADLDHFGLGAYKKFGFISSELENEAVSKTLEYAYNDYCLAVMARIMAGRKSGKTNQPVAIDYRADERRYLERAQFYRNLYDQKTGFMRPRQNGAWVSPFAPNEVTTSFTEGNSWVYSFFVPQDVSGLMKLMGGKEKFAAKLDLLFTTEEKLTGRFQPDITGLIGQYAHGNEPSHHIAYLYNYADKPWKTQQLVRRILDEFYKPEPDGLIGNEDCGQMSAWYILSALGFYQVNPGQGVYALGTPIFRDAKIKLENGRTFRITADDPSPKNFYVGEVRLNGRPHRQSFITHETLTKGGAIDFKMRPAPVTDWFTQSPVSEIPETLVVSPSISGSRVFIEQTPVTLDGPPDAKLEYRLTTDKTGDWKLYTAPLTLAATTKIEARTVLPNGQTSYVSESKHTRVPHDWSIALKSKYNRNYTGGGDFGLIDGVRGTVNFASGEWQGYQSQDFEAVVDLRRPTRISELGGGFLQVARSWIWMPTRVEFEVSDDGVEFRPAASMTTDVAPDNMDQIVRDYIVKIKPITTRFVRVRAVNLGKIPAWHPGAGSDAFIFIDEILIS